MLTKCNDVKPEKERKYAPFRKCIHVKGVYSELFLHQILTFFTSGFVGKVKFEAYGETKMILGRFAGMLPRKIFENSHTVMGILALFEQFVTQILFFCP